MDSNLARLCNREHTHKMDASNDPLEILTKDRLQYTVTRLIYIYSILLKGSYKPNKLLSEWESNEFGKMSQLNKFTSKAENEVINLSIPQLSGF